MQAETGKNNRHIAWNGVRLDIPYSWDTRVSGQRHLVFEKDFEPQLQIRWEKAEKYSSNALHGRSQHFAGQLGSLIAEDDFPAELRQVKDSFDMVTCYQGDDGTVAGGIILCTDGHTLVLFQLLFTDPSLFKEVNSCLMTLTCPRHPETLWRVQDFSLAIPVSFVLKDYTFAAGLTRLSFSSADLFLQTCKLGPADKRLKQQSLAEILITLTGTPDLLLATEVDGSCSGHRSPTIPKQVFLRLRREKPFVRAKIWHDPGNNRLLAAVLSSHRPIPLTVAENIYRHYEII